VSITYKNLTQSHAAEIQRARGFDTRHQDWQGRRGPVGRNTLGALGVNFFSFPEGVGFRKENTALRDEFNGFLANLKQDGTLADMVKRWVDNNISAMRAIANAGTNGELVVGISDGTLPFVAAKND
jgi:hypothetical protein